jgi:hypothetical protein
MVGLGDAGRVDLAVDVPDEGVEERCFCLTGERFRL